MNSARPYKVAINHDDYHAAHIGKTKTGYQFFLTTPFEPAIIDEGCEYIALFKFDLDGNHVESVIDKLGPRGSFSEEERKKKYFSRLNELGDIEYCRIEVKPFSVEKYGKKFGLITRVPENKEDVWAVELHPGNYMAFSAPWDNGEYDT
ncbi:MAG: hypothetical protein GY757_33555 [bacterium]|nr:hypothetical protein [bacterium]